MAGEKTALEKDALSRLKDCRDQKLEIERDLREGYFFLAPRRSREVLSTTAMHVTDRSEDSGELQTSFGMEVGQDFVTEIINTFMPQAIGWAQQRPGIDVNEDDWEEVEEQINKQTDAIHAAIKASNFYPAVAQAAMPDLPLGTMAMMIQDLRATEPIVCLPVPARELEINIGPYGEVDDRFIVRHTRYRHIPALLPGVKLPDEIAKKVKEKGSEKCRVAWGYWRLWERQENVVWQRVIMIGEKIVDSGELVGEGSCPLIVGRFNPDPMFAWGDGPTLQCLPELRHLDEVESLKIDNFDNQIHPPFAYPDDGVVNFSSGIEPGMGYPMRPGSGKDFVKLAFDGDPNIAEYVTEERHKRIRRLHFVDQPEQLGKTPPTAEQWLDENMRAKRRIGTPGLIFWREFPANVFLRFKWLLEKRMKIQPVKVDGKTVSLVPYDPTEIAQDHQDVNVARMILEVARTVFPQLAEVAIDPLETLKNIKKKLRDEVVVIRSQEELAQAVEVAAPIMGAGGGGGAPSGMAA